MFLHNKRMMFTVHVDQPDPRFAKFLLEQFGGPNGELAAALRYFTQAWGDSEGQPAADLRSDIAAEARAKIVYERLIKLTDDAGCKQENVPGDQRFEHTYFANSINGKAEIKPGFSLVEGASRFHFDLVTPADISAEPPELPDPHPSTASA
jgi:Mn-containing catalase